MTEQATATQASPEVSVILCVRNGAATICEQLDALGAQETRRDWELLIIDNGSSDGTAEVVRAWHASAPAIALRIVDAGSERGLAATRNRGAAAAAGRMLLFCDADDVASPGWIDALAQALERADLAGGPLGYERLNPPSVRGWQMGAHPVFTDALPGAPDMPYVIGANMAITAAMFARVGGCDEDLRGAWEDVDLSLRVAAAGGRLALAPDAVMHYRLRTSLKDAMDQSTHYGRGEASVRHKVGGSGALPPLDGQWARESLRSLLRPPSRAPGGRASARERLLQVAYLLGLLRGLAQLSVAQRRAHVEP